MTWRTRTPLSSHSAADFFCFKEMQELCCSRVSICILHIRLVTLQATLKRHVVTRCDDLRHTSRTNTPGEAPVLATRRVIGPSTPRGIASGGRPPTSVALTPTSIGVGHLG